MVSYAFIDPSEVAQLYHSGLEPGRDFQVVDVRDEDRIGGHLPGSMRAPSEQRTLQSVQDLVVKLEGVPKVIFHCTLSQIRGPKAASLYCTALNERPDALDFESATSNSIIENSGTPLTATSTKDSTNTRAAQNFSPNPFELKASASEQNRSQQVLVLRGGFGEWQRMYKARLDFLDSGGSLVKLMNFLDFQYRMIRNWSKASILRFGQRGKITRSRRWWKTLLNTYPIFDAWE